MSEETSRRVKSTPAPDLPGFTRISGFPHVWPYVLMGPLVVIIAGAIAHWICRDLQDSERMGAAIVTAIATGIIGLIYQHGFAKFRCKRCGKTMTKHRHPDTTAVAFHYACEHCRTFWSNVAVRFK